MSENYCDAEKLSLQNGHGTCTNEITTAKQTCSSLVSPENKRISRYLYAGESASYKHLHRHQELLLKSKSCKFDTCNLIRLYHAHKKSSLWQYCLLGCNVPTVQVTHEAGLNTTYSLYNSRGFSVTRRQVSYAKDFYKKIVCGTTYLKVLVISFVDQSIQNSYMSLISRVTFYYRHVGCRHNSF